MYSGCKEVISNDWASLVFGDRFEPKFTRECRIRTGSGLYDKYASPAIRAGDVFDLHITVCGKHQHDRRVLVTKIE
jgi:hypothetical protein